VKRTSAAAHMGYGLWSARDKHYDKVWHFTAPICPLNASAQLNASLTGSTRGVSTNLQIARRLQPFVNDFASINWPAPLALHRRRKNGRQIVSRGDSLAEGDGSFS
jgi:hypothetical protein